MPNDVDRAERDAQRLDLGDQQRGDEGAGNRAHAADDDDDERLADRVEVEAELAGSRGSCSAPPSAASKAPSANTAGEEPPLG